MLLPECPLPFDVTCCRLGIGLPIITLSADRRTVHRVGGEVLTHRQVGRSRSIRIELSSGRVQEVGIKIFMGGWLNLPEAQGRTIAMML